MAVDGINQAEKNKKKQRQKKKLEDAISQLARVDIRLKFIMSTKQNHVCHWWEVGAVPCSRTVAREATLFSCCTLNTRQGRL